MTLPDDFALVEALAIFLLFFLWFAYSAILRLISRGSLNEQLSTVRAQWMLASISRAQKPFDAILLGHMVNSIAFFGSATMIVLAGVITLFANANAIYEMVQAIEFASQPSFGLFTIHLGVLGLTLALAFFSFTYALRKLIYVIALAGAIPEGQLRDEDEVHRQAMVDNAATVLSEATKTFNFGIRGYYYSVAALGLFISPYLCFLLTFIATATLIYRQIGTKTAAAIQDYVEASRQLNKDGG